MINKSQSQSYRVRVNSLLVSLGEIEWVTFHRQSRMLNNFKVFGPFFVNLIFEMSRFLESDLWAMAIWKLATSIRKKRWASFTHDNWMQLKRHLRLFSANVKCREFLISYAFLPSYYSHSWASITILFSNSFTPTNSVQNVILYPGNNWQLPPCQKSMKLNILSAQFRRVAT